MLLAESDDRELVVNALRAGAKGIFLFTHTPFPMLCKCIHCVFQGEVWINSQQMNYVLDALSEVPTLRVVNSNGRSLLTPREEQVVALVADGLTNRGVAAELGLSEHTIKKYLLRIFDKVGIFEPGGTGPLRHVARRASPGGMDAEQRLSAEAKAARIQWQYAERRGDRSVTSSGSVAVPAQELRADGP